MRQASDPHSDAAPGSNRGRGIGFPSQAKALVSRLFADDRAIGKPVSDLRAVVQYRQYEQADANVLENENGAGSNSFEKYVPPFNK